MCASYFSANIFQKFFHCGKYLEICAGVARSNPCGSLSKVAVRPPFIQKKTEAGLNFFLIFSNMKLNPNKSTYCQFFSYVQLEGKMARAILSNMHHIGM
jgi:hypothetical protein